MSSRARLRGESSPSWIPVGLHWFRSPCNAFLRVEATKSSSPLGVITAPPCEASSVCRPSLALVNDHRCQSGARPRVDGNNDERLSIARAIRPICEHGLAAQEKRGVEKLGIGSRQLYAVDLRNPADRRRRSIKHSRELSEDFAAILADALDDTVQPHSDKIARKLLVPPDVDTIAVMGAGHVQPPVADEGHGGRRLPMIRMLGLQRRGSHDKENECRGSNEYQHHVLG